jgi:hypothetical protein
MAAHGGSGDLKVVEQLLCLAGVFAGDPVGAAEDVEGAQGDVAEVADGGGDQIETWGEKSCRDLMGLCFLVQGLSSVDRGGANFRSSVE